MPSKPTMRVARSRLLLWASVLCSAALCESQASNPIGEVTIRLADLVQTYDGAPKTVSVIPVPPNLPVTISYDGSSDAPSDTGSYTVIAEVNLPLVQVSAKNTLT